MYSTLYLDNHPSEYQTNVDSPSDASCLSRHLEQLSGRRRAQGTCSLAGGRLGTIRRVHNKERYVRNRDLFALCSLLSLRCVYSLHCDKFNPRVVGRSRRIGTGGWRGGEVQDLGGRDLRSIPALVYGSMREAG
jgi:hypothetical protein